MTPWEKYLQEKKRRRKEKKRGRGKASRLWSLEVPVVIISDHPQEETAEEEEEEEGREEEGVAEGDLGFDDPFFQHKVSITSVSWACLPTAPEKPFHNWSLF